MTLDPESPTSPEYEAAPPMPGARAATFTDMLLAHNVIERALVATIRKGGKPDFTAHHQLEEAMCYAMAGLTNDEVAAAIEAYDATPGAML